MKTKNLLIISSAYPYLSDYGGIFVKEQVNCLKSEFNQITVISPRLYYPKVLLNIKKFRDFVRNNSQPTNHTYENVQVFFPKCIPLPPFIDSFMKMIVSLQLSATIKLIKEQEIKFDIIHSHFILPAGYLGLKLKEMYDVPLVITGHGGDVYSQPFRNEWFLNQTKCVLEKADAIITTSIINKNIITDKIGISKTKVKIIVNGFDEKLFYPMEKIVVRNKLLLPQNCKIILSVGNLVEIKGHRYLIDAINKIIPTYPDVLCIIIGGGSKIELQDLIEKFNLTDYVKITGAKPHEELPFWMNACDIFVLPSIDEGFPTVIPEVLGCGKPVVATSVGGIPEIIKNDNIGLLVKKQNSESLSKGILRALGKKWDVEQIAEYANKNYTWHRLSDKILDIYEFR